MSHPDLHSAPVRAPDFPSALEWINTGNSTRSLSELRGKIVLLDFWTYG